MLGRALFLSAGREEDLVVIPSSSVAAAVSAVPPPLLAARSHFGPGIQSVFLTVMNQIPAKTKTAHAKWDGWAFWQATYPLFWPSYGCSANEYFLTFGPYLPNK